MPYTWYYYDDVEDINELLSSLASKGLRESVLHQVLDGEKVNIEKNVKRKRYDNLLLFVLFLIELLGQSYLRFCSE